MSSEPAIDSFLNACGMAGPLVLELEERRVGTVQRLVYDQPFVVVGRMPDSDLQLDDEQISRRHAYFQVVTGRLYCVDLASRGGIHWNDGTHGSGWLSQGRALEIGPYVIRPRDQNASHPDEGSPRSAPSASTPVKQRPLPRVVLEFPGRGVAQPPWRMNRTLALVGRSPECKVLLSGNDVSLFHCSLVRTVMGVWVVNLLAREGTRVNGQLVRAALLADGDELEVGHYRIQLRYGSSTGHASATIPFPRPAASPKPKPLDPPPLPSAVDPLDPAASMSMILAQRPNLPAMPDMRGLLVGRSPEQIELAESVLVPVINQFGQMHQQMFDQFQQMMMMAFQMFATMHRDQMTVVREEMAQIHRLTDELHTLQAQVQAVAAQQAQAPVSPAPVAASDPDRTDERPTLNPAPDPMPADQSPPEPSPTPQDASDSSAEQPVATPSTPPAADPWAQQGAAMTQLHTQLARRIATLQEERQTRWQKIMGLVTGGQAGRGRGGS